MTSPNRSDFEGDLIAAREDRMTRPQSTTFTLYRAVIGNAVGRWNVAEGEPPTDILGYPIETIVVMPIHNLHEREETIRARH